MENWGNALYYETKVHKIDERGEPPSNEMKIKMQHSTGEHGLISSPIQCQGTKCLRRCRFICHTTPQPKE
ncbi:hypothetical protein VNO80_09552 [Phaseolus coccineus]|uniref:Uncharacterized protein n=1 Tax=Phaseolus coccineus TaxID=3886 RepID=A0AAN9NBU1_PHACN